MIANTQQLLFVGGVLHFVLLIASAIVPFVFDWKGNLRGLNSFLRSLMWVYGAFIVLTVLGFGAISVFHAEALSANEPLARSVCLFIALFWLMRLTVQFFVFDISAIVKNRLLKAGYHLLTLVFMYLVLAYGSVALGYGAIS